MNHLFTRRGIVAACICVLFIAGGVLLAGTPGMAKQKSEKTVAQQNAYAVYLKKCLDCHVSVADPEKPGRTRDDWHLVVNVMHDYGLALTNEESEMIIDLLYDLRKGMERDAG